MKGGRFSSCWIAQLYHNVGNRKDAAQGGVGRAVLVRCMLPQVV